ncbi:MAG: protein translocase subunit SecF, partial [Candidatus Paceibacteria bacterium]
MNIIGRRKIFYVISGTIITLSILSVALFRFRFGIDFLGGTFWELRFDESAAGASTFTHELKNIFSENQIDDLILQKSDTSTFALRLQEISESKHQELLSLIKSRWPDTEELRFETVGPTIGKTLRRKAIQSIVLVLFGISLYIAWAFRKVSRPLTSWKYGVVTVFTLFHDVIAPIGLFSYLGKLGIAEIDSNFIVALLVVMGFSVHDTIVVFDRVRENL